MLEFPYLAERISGQAAPSLPLHSIYHWRPFVPVKILTPSGFAFRYHRALLDSGSQDTILPIDAAQFGGIPLLADTGHKVRWRGILHPLRFSRTTFRIQAQATEYEWESVVGFSPSRIRYPILGIAGFLEYFDTTFRGADRIVELVPNQFFPGTVRTLV